jgi:iron complex transport system permease protein
MDIRRRFPLVVLGLAVAAGIAFFLSIALGSVSLPLGEILSVFLHRITGLGEAPSGRVEAIAWFIRLPRSLAALFAGFALALSGAAVQGVFRNPMASPDILGISAGSSFGAVLSISLGAALMHPTVLPASAFAGAMTAAIFVYLIGSDRGRSHLLFVILAGLAVSSLLNGLVSALLLFSDRYEMSIFLFWTMGGLEGTQFDVLLIPVPVIAVASLLLLRMGRPLNLLALGDEQAHSLGLPVERTKLTVLGLAALLTSMAIALAGPIGFVGLMIPHLLRVSIGSNHLRLLPASALAGSAFLLLSDTLGRIIARPYEIKTGIITALIGGPYFIFLIIRYQRKGRLI